MAASSKVKFRLEDLQKKAIESIDFRIGQAERELEEVLDGTNYEEEVKGWRAEQEERVSNLFRRLGDRPGVDPISDEELEEFRVARMPERSRLDITRARGKVENLRHVRSQIEAKSTSLAADEDGTIALTKSQLRDFFEL